MPGRRRIDTPAPIRSSIADAAFAVEERLVWGGADVVRGIVDVIKWPFERAIWAVERGFVWPLEERTGDWDPQLRAVGVGVLALLAAGAGVLGLLWASGSGSGGTSPAPEASAPVAAPIVRQIAPPATAATPVLQGAKPDFADAPQSSASKSSSANAEGTVANSGSTTGTGSTAEVAKSANPGGGEATGAATVKPAGPPATKVAHQFANAFVLYEIGRATPEVRDVFNETAAPRLARELLRRPPRQPAGVAVPKAKVLNVVAGPHHGDTYTLSVSLLRVGVTSELRLDLERNPKSGEWEVDELARLMGRLRNTLAVAAVGAALSATQANAAAPEPAAATAPTLEQNESLAAPAAAPAPQPSGGTAVEAPAEEKTEASEPTPESEPDAGAVPAPTPSELFQVPSIPSSSCASSGVPPVLIPDLPARRQCLRPRSAGRGDPRLDQWHRERLRHQHGTVLSRRDRLDAVPALDLGNLGSRRQRRRRARPL